MISKTPIKLSTLLFGTIFTLLSGCSAFNHEPNKLSSESVQNRSSKSYKVGSCDQYSNQNGANGNVVSYDSGSDYDGSNYGNGWGDYNSALQSDAPDRYVVKKGDTLWDISATFLKQPWFWPEIWHVNPEVLNPHLIYPGDVLSLYYVDGQPRIGINRGNDAKLSPTIRSTSLANDEPVSIAALRPFMIRPSVVTEEELRNAAHVVGSVDDRMIYGTGDSIYIHKLQDQTIGAKYSIYRPNKKLYSPRRPKEVLGYEAIYATDARVTKQGNPATVILENGKREVLNGDRVLPIDINPADLQFFPHAPPPHIEGTVISIFDALSGIAQYQVAVVDLGERDCIEPGHVIAINKAGRMENDEFHHRMRPDTDLWDIGNNRKIQLPDEQSGVMMIFRTFEKVSYGLIMDAHRAIKVGDSASNPGTY